MVGIGNVYTASTGSKSSSKASEAVPHSQECEERDLAKSRTALTLKPELYGRGPVLFGIFDVIQRIDLVVRDSTARMTGATLNAKRAGGRKQKEWIVPPF